MAAGNRRATGAPSDRPLCGPAVTLRRQARGKKKTLCVQGRWTRTRANPRSVHNEREEEEERRGRRNRSKSPPRARESIRLPRSYRRRRVGRTRTNRLANTAHQKRVAMATPTARWRLWERTPLLNVQHYAPRFKMASRRMDQKSAINAEGWTKSSRAMMRRGM